MASHGSPDGATHSNRLAQASSPYLLQHAANPVDWMEWGEEAFSRARAEGKPILLSVGYAACHWCHVMAHESFENPEIARLQNELFVSIKVDREERPDIDGVYQYALALLGQQGGWPLTMFLTPDGAPFWGGTYFPPTQRWGRMGFPDLLRAIAGTYSQEHDKVVSNVASLRDGLQRITEGTAGDAIPPGLLEMVAERLAPEFDPANGGIGGAPKFPHGAVFELILRAWLRTGDQSYRDAIETTLDHICQGGIYDHLGGGFARYATDAAWLVPHFEKMLYDNAQLIQLLTLSWQATGKPLYATRVRETVAWVLREMVAEDGGFASSLDADSEAEEGKYYVWSKAEIDTLLGAGAALFARVYDVQDGGNWEGKTILHRNHDGGAFGSDEDEARLAPMRANLLAARNARVRPGWDDKVLADWNGLMIAALAEAGFVFGEPGWIVAAERAFAAVTAHEAEGRLAHSWRAGRVSARGLLEDYALMSQGALKLAEVTGKPEYLAAARRWADVLDRHFWDRETGGHFQIPDDGEALIVRTKSAADHAVPSGNGAMVGVLTRLALATGDNAYADRAEALVRAFSGGIERNYFPLATVLNGVEGAAGAVEIVIAGPPCAETNALIEIVRHAPLPDRWLTRVLPGASLPESHPAAGKSALDGGPTAYVCRGRSCSPPVTKPEQLTALLRRPPRGAL